MPYRYKKEGPMWPLIIVLAFLLIMYLLLATPDPANGRSQECFYPMRELRPDGSCDNRDPCDPERIKVDGGKCIKGPDPVQPMQDDGQYLRELPIVEAGGK